MFKKRQPQNSVQADALQSQAAAFPPIGTTLPQPYYRPAGINQPSNTSIAIPNSESVKAAPGSWKARFKKAFIVLLIIAALIGGFLGVKFLINASKTFNGNLFGLLQNDQLKGEDQGRVNILVAGNSADDAGHNGAQLTDSILLISLDTKNNKTFMLSIPRDLYVDIPDNGYAKINEAYPDGESDKFSETGYADGGMGLLEKVVSENLGIDINYYALINYTAFRDAVDSAGGIDVTIQSSDPRGLYDPSRDYSKPYKAPLVKLTNGPNHLDGQTALNLARARGDAYGAYGYAQSDYTRTANQRLMLVALKDKAGSASVALNPVKIASLLDSFGNNVTTDFKTSEVRRLYDLSKKIPSSSITSVGLNDVNGQSLLKSYTTRSGQSALVPAAGVDDYSDIQAFLQQLMTPPTPAPSPNSHS